MLLAFLSLLFILRFPSCKKTPDENVVRCSFTLNDTISFINEHFMEDLRPVEQAARTHLWFLSANLNNTLYDIGLILHTGVERILNIIQFKAVCDDIFNLYFSG